MSNPEPTEPCWCGSNVAYKDCHMQIDLFPPDMRLFGARQNYANKWEKSALNIDQQGGYDWMSEILAEFQPRHILDIGCGTGHGILSMFRRFANLRLISVDENPEVISRARERMLTAGARVNVVSRLCDKATSDRSHKLHIKPNQLRMRPGVNLIESDILDDPELNRFFKSQKKFDAITVWLIGSHLLRYHESDDLRGKINSPVDYRLEMQTQAFALAALFLREGGALQIVDRGPKPETTEMQEAVLTFPRMMAELTKGLMHITDLQYREYTETNALPTVRIVDTEGKVVDNGKLALISIIAVKASELSHKSRKFN